MSKTKDIKTFIILFLVFIAIKLAVMPYVVSGESMYPTLHNGQLGVGVRTSFEEVHRFDIVVVRANNKYLIKRVIGLPGEKVEYRDNKLYIDDVEVTDPYNFGNTGNFNVTLKDNEFYCLGDNREHSSDSRTYGPFDKIYAVSIKRN